VTIATLSVNAILKAFPKWKPEIARPEAVSHFP